MPETVVETTATAKPPNTIWAKMFFAFEFILLLLCAGCLWRVYYVSPDAVLIHRPVKASHFSSDYTLLADDMLVTLDQSAPGKLELLISSPPGENQSRTLLPYYNPASGRYPEVAIALDRIFLVDSAGFLHCHERQGRELWQLPNSSLDWDLHWGQSPAVNHGQLLVLQPGWLVAMDVDANVLWKHRREGHFGKSLTAPDCAYIYFQTDKGVDILSQNGELLAHSETGIPYLPDYAFTADGALLFATGPDFGFEQTVMLLNPDGNSSQLYRIADADFPVQKARAIHALQMIDNEQLLIVSDAGLYICDLQGSARRLTMQSCITARYLSKNEVIAWEPQLYERVSLFSLPTQDHIYLMSLDGAIQKEYVKSRWGCEKFTEDSAGNIYVIEYGGDVRRLDF